MPSCRWPRRQSPRSWIFQHEGQAPRPSLSSLPRWRPVKRGLAIGLTAALALALIVAAILGLLRRLPDNVAPPAPRSVPSAWSDVRESFGHQAHVGKKGIVCNDC